MLLDKRQVMSGGSVVHVGQNDCDYNVTLPFVAFILFEDICGGV